MVQHNSNATTLIRRVVPQTIYDDGKKAILLTKKWLYKLWDQKNLIHICCAKQTANGFLFLPEKRNSFDNLHSTLMNLLEKDQNFCVDGPAM